MSKHSANTVAELIYYLKKLDQDALVILSSDAEGNSYSPLVLEHGEGYYKPDSTWSGEWVDEEDLQEYDEEDKKKIYKAVFLFPVN